MKPLVISVVSGSLRTITNLGKMTESVRNQMTSRCHPNYSIVEIGQNNEKSPGELGRLTATQSSVKDHQLTME